MQTNLVEHLGCGAQVLAGVPFRQRTKLSQAVESVLHYGFHCAHSKESSALLVLTSEDSKILFSESS